MDKINRIRDGETAKKIIDNLYKGALTRFEIQNNFCIVDYLTPHELELYDEAVNILRED